LLSSLLFPNQKKKTINHNKKIQIGWYNERLFHLQTYLRHLTIEYSMLTLLSQTHFGQSGRMQLPPPKVGDLESSRTPENSEDDLRGQISLHWRVLYVIGKFLKFRCPKWPRMSHLDICSPSYGQKKGWESNWQFDSRPLKVENRPLPDVRF
jgi:hypothetical protein